MGVSSSFLSRVEVQQLLGVNTFGMWRVVRKYDRFPKPTHRPGRLATFRDKEPEEVWDGTQVYRWAARTPEFAHRGAVLLRPLPEGLAPGRWPVYKDTLRGPAQDWHTVLGVIRLLHCDDREAATDVASAIAQAENPDGVVTVCALYGDMGFHGPALVAADTAQPGIEYEADWGNIATLAGQDLPWWPDLLRLPQVIRMWQPGAPPAVVEVPANDDEEILRRAAGNATFDGPSRAAVTDMANSIRNNRIDNTTHEIDIFCEDGPHDRPNPIVAGALPDTTHHPLPCDEKARPCEPAGAQSPCSALRTPSLHSRSPSAATRTCCPSGL
ncbi:hypothetical protein ACFZAV_16355 [Streptomyces sp. NPDC008343]|uniref:hypothetical protein n=1 Tax=Streptomyces sp. NPDC008343 TaxID=3364828 RepID=UPI0036E28484